MNSQNIIVDSKKIHLTDTCYKAKGGQGSIYLKNNTIFKIYHNKTDLISEQKIHELRDLSPIKNIIVPQKTIYNEQNERIGFTLQCIDNFEYLCKVFTQSFKTRNGLTIKNIADIVDNMRDTLIKIHEKNIVVGDYNEMNFLIDNLFKTVFYIDTDSYQTKSFKCNAIMHQFRDRLFPLGTFNKQSDWFSWSLVSFLLYVGIHPFKGRHSLSMDERMDNNVSVFDKSVKVPKNIDFNIIPSNHLEYYKRVFINKERDIPPKSEGAENIQVVRKIYVDDKSSVYATLIHKYDSNILDAVYRDGDRWVLTEKSVYKNDRLYFNNTRMTHLVFSSDNSVLQEKGISFNNAIYKITETGIIQTTYEKFGKIIPIPKTISTVAYNSSKMYQGVILQDIYGKYTATIPYALDLCSNIKIHELDNTRIIDANRQGKWLFVVYKKGNKTNCLIAQLKKNYTQYECSVIENVDFLNINMLVKSNGVVVFNSEDCKFELFTDLKEQTKIIENTPIYNDCKLIELHKTCFVHNNELYELNNK